MGQALWAVTHPGLWQASSIGFAAMAMVVIMGARRINPSLPGVLFATTLALIISTTADYGGGGARGYPHPRDSRRAGTALAAASLPAHSGARHRRGGLRRDHLHQPDVRGPGSHALGPEPRIRQPGARQRHLGILRRVPRRGFLQPLQPQPLRRRAHTLERGGERGCRADLPALRLGAGAAAPRGARRPSSSPPWPRWCAWGIWFESGGSPACRRWWAGRPSS